MTKPRKSLIRERFGILTVIEQTDDFITKDGSHKTMWRCVCDCGKEINVIQDNPKRGNTKSCGCTRSRSNTSHGARHTRLYSIWTNMKSRCSDANNPTFANYGARGITVCDEWNDSFIKFQMWAHDNGYDEKLTIDMIDNNKGYYPENCRWVDATVQANNRRSSRYIVVNGVSKSLAEWADYLGYSRSIFHARAKLYNTTVEEQVRKLVN